MKRAYSELLKLVEDAPSLAIHGYRHKAFLGDEAFRPATESIRTASPPGRSEPANNDRLPEATGTTKKTAAAIQPSGYDSIVPVSIAEFAGMDIETAMNILSDRVRSCRNCGLCEKRNKAVPGTGSLHPQVMVIGEGPGADEDRTGLPFVGAAGQFLDKWLKAIGLSRYENTFIANVVKCRPPQNRDPLPEEISACTPYLVTQIRLLKPKALLIVGRIAAGYVMNREVRMHEIRGKTFEYMGVPCVATYHPSAVLRNDDLKRPVWEDLKRFKQLLDGEAPSEEL